jgi:hypothetical protein
LSAPTKIRTHETHKEFEKSAAHEGDLLRGWTKLDVIDLAPISEWARRDDEGVVQRVTHELCHAAIEQRFGSAERARAAHVPRLFSEGACTIIAGQMRDYYDEHYLSPARMENMAEAHDEWDLRVPSHAYERAYAAMLRVDEKLGPLGFARIVDTAASDGEPGCIERALHEAGVDIDSTQP